MVTEKACAKNFAGFFPVANPPVVTFISLYYFSEMGDKSCSVKSITRIRFD